MKIASKFSIFYRANAPKIGCFVFWGALPLYATLPTGLIPLVYDEDSMIQSGYFLKDTEVEQIPQWRPNIDLKLPVSLAKIISNGISELAAQNPNYLNYELVKISLKPIIDEKLKNRWFYVLSIIVKEGNIPHFRLETKVKIIMTLDGRVVPHKRL